VSLIGHIAYVGDIMNAYRIFVGKPKGIRPLGRPRNRWRTILKWILWAFKLDTFGLMKGPIAGSCQHGNRYLGFIKGR
jgi:hypothetical protein